MRKTLPFFVEFLGTLAAALVVGVAHEEERFHTARVNRVISGASSDVRFTPNFCFVFGRAAASTNAAVCPPAWVCAEAANWPLNLAITDQLACQM